MYDLDKRDRLKRSACDTLKKKIFELTRANKYKFIGKKILQLTPLYYEIIIIQW